MIGGILAPFLEVGFGAVRQVISPCRLERSSGIIECLGGAVSLFAGIAAPDKTRNEIPTDLTMAARRIAAGLGQRGHRHNESASVPVVGMAALKR
jgi:hypothetical protein